VPRLPASPRLRPALDREHVVDAALALVGREGFAALSMRRVAADMGVGTMSLYWHVPNREDLLDLMFERAVGAQVLEAVPTDWREALEEIAHAARRVFSLHPWLLEAGPRPRAGSLVLEHVEQLIAATEGMHLPFAQRLAAVSAVDDYVLGHAVGALARPSAGSPALTEQAAAALADGRYPRYAAALAESAAAHSWFAGQHFEVGLALVLDGIAAAVAAGTMPGMSPPTAPPPPHVPPAPQPMQP
jgi:AcrR family transcriptional regulator